MKSINALIKKYGIRVSKLYCRSLEIWMELKLADGGGVLFCAWGAYTEDWNKNNFAYALKRILDIVGVDAIEDIEGKPIRALFEGEGKLGDRIIGIGNFLSEDWFIIEEEKLWKSER